MTKKKKKESWKEKRRRATLKHQRMLKAERSKRDTEPKKSKGISKTKLLGVILLASLVLIVGAYAAMQNEQAASDNTSDNRQPAPLFTLADIDGNQVALEDLKGKIAVLNFFDTQCRPCITEISDLKPIYNQYGEDVAILSIDVDPDSDSVAILQQFRETNQIGWTILRDTASVFFEYVSGPPYYTPTTVVVDKEGYIYETHTGWYTETDPSELINEIDDLLGS